MRHDPDRHHRRSIRLAGYDYNCAGAYYLTICTHRRGRLFGQIAGQAMLANPYGQIVAICWANLPDHFAHATVDTFVVMPDHVHGIVILNATQRQTLPIDTIGPRGTVQGSLAAVVQNFKSVSSRLINQLRNTPAAPIWQRNYYDHIVRDAADMERIRRYIAANPARWRGR